MGISPGGVIRREFRLRPVKRMTTNADIAAIAGRVLGASVFPEAVQRIKEGLTNESWLVDTENGRVVVRLSTADDRLLRIDRRSEQLVLAAVERAGIGAEVLFASREERILVTRYIEGCTWTRDDMLAKDNIRHVAILMQRLHALPPPAGVVKTDLSGVLEDYWEALDRLQLPGPPGFWDRRELREVAAALSSGATHCLCHNDVHHLNLIYADRLWLVDWEYAGIGDPSFDLASICCYHGYGETERRLLLRYYLGRDSDAAYARLELACWLFEYIRDVWQVLRVNASAQSPAPFSVC